MADDNKQKICFVIAPIGPNAVDPIRIRSNQVLKHIIEPIARDCDYTQVIRADKDDRPGLITKQIIDHLLNDDLVVADLTGRNANVYYELAIRHASGKPIVQLIDSSESLPFDLSDTRTIKVDIHDLDSVADCKEELRRQILVVEKDSFLVNTPLSRAIEFQAPPDNKKDPNERMFLQIMERISELAFSIRDVERRVQTQARDSAISRSWTVRPVPSDTDIDFSSKEFNAYLAHLRTTGELTGATPIDEDFKARFALWFRWLRERDQKRAQDGGSAKS